MIHQRRAVIAVAFLVSLATFLVFLPALNNGFVRWDDPDYIYDNPHIRSIDAAFFRWAFFDFHAANWHPVTWISYALDYAAWGYNPLGYHLTSVIVHALNTFLVVMLVSELVSGEKRAAFLTTNGLSRQVFIAVTAGVLFGIHPLHVESVAWASERKDVLCAFFFLSSLICYVRYASAGRERRAAFYWWSFLLFVLSLMSKPMAVSLPLVILLLDWYPLFRLDEGSHETIPRLLREKTPFFLAAAGSILITLGAQQNPLAGTEALYAGERIVVAIRGFVFYLEKFLLPVGLVHFYPLIPPVQLSWKDLLYCIVTAAVFVLGIIQWRRGSRLWLAGWGYYGITLAPVLGIVQVGQQAAADRYTYLPLLGIIVLASVGLAAGVAKIGTSIKGKIAAGIMAGLFAGVMAYATTQQIRVWKDTLTLWDRAIRYSPLQSPKMYQARGTEFFLRGDLARATADFDEAIRLAPPGYPIFESYYNRGLSHFLSGRADLALHDFEKALLLKPDHRDASYYRALTYSAVNKLPYQITP